MQSHQNLVEEAHEPLNINVLPDGFKTARVRNSLDDLNDQLEALVVLIQQVEQQVPQPETEFAITGVKYSPASPTPIHKSLPTLTIFGNGFDHSATVSFISESGGVIPGDHSEFYSSQRIDCDRPRPANYVVTVTNPNNESATLPITVTSSGAHINRRVTVNI